MKKSKHEWVLCFHQYFTSIGLMSLFPLEISKEKRDARFSLTVVGGNVNSSRGSAMVVFCREE